MYQVQVNFYSQISGGTASMPRPKSDLTKSGRTIGVRMREWEYQEWVRLGSTKWLRQQLMNSKRRQQTAQEKQDAVS
jgi:hypothetical protein